MAEDEPVLVAGDSIWENSDKGVGRGVRRGKGRGCRECLPSSLSGHFRGRRPALKAVPCEVTETLNSYR